MRFLASLVAVALVVSLFGCGSRVKVKKDSKKATTEPSTPAASTPTTPTPSTPATPSTPTTPSTPAPEPKPSTEAPKPPPQPSQPGEFASDVVGGKTIGEWIGLLDSKNKDQVIEACAALEIVRGKGASALPKLNELAKNSDKDIAAAADAAIKKVSGK